MSFEWQKMTLKQAGVTLIDCDHRTPPPTANGYPYIAIPQLKNGHIELEGVRRISTEHFLEWTKKLKPQEDDVIVVRRCNSGDSAVIPKDIECAIGQNLVILRSDGKIVYPKLLRWLLRSPDWWEQVSKFINVGAVFDSLKCKEIPYFELTIPPIKSQKEIATTLGALDDRITLLRETNATLEAIAQTLFKSWFVDFDPVHAKAQGTKPEGMDEQTAALFPDSFEESELGMVPAGWEVGELADMSKNNSTPFDFSKVEKVVFVNTGDVFNGEFLHQNYSLKEGLPGQAKKAIYENDILFSEIRPKNGRFAYVNFDAKDYVVSTKFMVLRAINNFPPRYLYQVLRQTETIEYFHVIAESRSGTFPQITFDSVKNYKLIKPSSVCLEKYIECVNPIFHKIDLLNKQAQTLSNLRDTLLPRLISGQLRLPDVEA
jgi:type I restriction enzyme S subunit